MRNESQSEAGHGAGTTAVTEPAPAPTNDVHSATFQSQLDPFFSGSYKGPDYAPWYERPKRRGLHDNYIPAKVVWGEKAQTRKRSLPCWSERF